MTEAAPPSVLRPPAEQRFAAELQALVAADEGPRPAGWRLSPRGVRAFICGRDDPAVTRKFYGDDALVERTIVGLATERGVLLVGEPGTAKSMLSELLAAAICGDSTTVIQGSAGTTEDQIKYSWNYALLLAEGPSRRALVPAPLHLALEQGRLVRFEEITRCPPEVQDVLVSVLSEKALAIPELPGEERLLLARPGFNVIATANIRDRGVHEMSSALKRRFNFETVRPIQDRQLEMELVTRECQRLVATHKAPVALDPDVMEVLVGAFRDLRTGTTPEGIPVERPRATMSTAEAVSVGLAAALDAYYYGERTLTADRVARHLSGGLSPEDGEDLLRMHRYFETVVQRRGATSDSWKALWEAREALPTP